MTDRDPTPITGTWRGHDQFCCRLCAYDTLDEAKFIDHFARAHPPLEIIDGGQAGEPGEVSERMTRDQLNAHGERIGFPDAAGFPGTKADLTAAFEQFLVLKERPHDPTNADEED